MSDTHIDNTLVFETTAGGVEADDLHLREMHGQEMLSAPYEFRLSLVCAIDGGLAPEVIEEMLASTCKIGFGPGGLQVVSGVLRQIELVDVEARGTRAVYEAVLVPRFWLSTLTRRSRCFNDKSIPDILAQVLQEMGLADGTDFEVRLVGSYSALEYVVQYEESDFAFLNRWMERLGMFYFWEQSEDTEKLVITDSNTQLIAVPDHAECIYSPRADTAIVGGVQGMRRRDRRIPNKLHVRDYNWRTPARSIRGDADVDTEYGFGLQAFTGDHFKDDGEGSARATLRAEGFNAQKSVYSTQTANPDFAPGFSFELSGAPVGELDDEYLITRVVHDAEQHSGASGGGDYVNRIEAILLAVPYRAPRITAWPKIEGIIHARIDAESVNSAAPIDDEGRYRVVFPYDLYGEYGGKATRWVRKAEPYSGPSYGMHFTLHVGSEVAIAHVYGDPDRPLIIGAIPNPATITPLTSTNATRSAIRSRSGILIDFEDDA